MKGGNMIPTIPESRVYHGMRYREIGIIPKTSTFKRPVSEIYAIQKRSESMKNQKELDDLLKHDKWLSYTKDRFEAADVQRRVKELFCEESSKLRTRQEKLRNLLRSEEYKHYDEVACLKEITPDKEDIMKEKEKELFQQKERERVAFVLDKYEQQFRNNSEELRNRNYGFNREFAAREQREQMEQKRVLENLKLEEEKVYLAMWQADLEAKNKKEEEVNEKKKNIIKETHCTLLKQIAEKEEKRKEEEAEKKKELEEMLKEMQELEKEKLQEEENKRMKLLKNIEEANEYNKKRREWNEAERQRELQHTQKILKQVTQLQTENLQAKQDKRDLQKAQENYLQYSNYVKEERLRQERCDEASFKEENDKYWSRWHETSRSADAAKRCDLLAINAERKLQADLKFEERRRRLKGDGDEREALLQEARADKQKEMQQAQAQRESSIEYYESLKGQMRYNRELLEARLQEDRRMQQKQQEAEEEYMRKVNYYKTRPLLHKTHPLKKHLLFPELSCKSILNARLKPDGARYCRSGTLN